MYKKIVNPNTNRYVNVNTILGRKIINNYFNSLMKGGTTKLFLPDIGWTDLESPMQEEKEIEYLPEEFQTHEEIQDFFENKPIIQEYLQDDNIIDNIRDKFEGLDEEDTIESLNLSKEDIETWITLWLYSQIIENPYEMDPQEIVEYIGKNLIKEKENWINLKDISDFQKEIPKKVLDSSDNLNTLINYCANLHIMQLIWLGL